MRRKQNQATNGRRRGLCFLNEEREKESVRGGEEEERKAGGLTFSRSREANLSEGKGRIDDGRQEEEGRRTSARGKVESNARGYYPRCHRRRVLSHF